MFIRALVVSGVAAGCLAACTGLPPAADKAVLYNEAVADAGNRLVLLNAARASQRLPMYYTRFSNLQSAGTLSTGLTTGFSLGPKGPDTVGFSLPISGSQVDTVGIQVLDEQKFLQGILDRTKPETLAFYITQGWPKDLLFHLFLERIEVEPTLYESLTAPNGKDSRALADLKGRASCYPKPPAQAQKAVTTSPTSPDKKAKWHVFDNDPTDPERFACFQSLIHLLEQDEFELTIDKTIAFESTGIAIKEKDADLTEPAVEALKAGYVIKRIVEKDPKVENDKGKCVTRVGKETPKAVFSLRGPSGSALPQRSNAKPLAAPESNLGTAVSAAQDDAWDVCDNKNEPERGSLDIKFVLRSPDSMIYYLGEVIRARHPTEKNKAPLTVQINVTGGGKADLFRVDKGYTIDAAVSVSLDHSVYAIPAIDEEPEHRSMQVINLINQVLGLQKESSTSPTVVPITVINTP